MHSKIKMTDVADFISTESVTSMLYASEIQKGLLPKKRHFDKMNMDYGILYWPHSVLSGDFYWLGLREDKIFLAVADCTGKGISASLLSVMGISLLNYVILSKSYDLLGDYLKELDKKWLETFQSENEDKMFNNDWMEIALLKIDRKNFILEFSGAKLPVIVKKVDGRLLEMMPNRYPIGGWQIEKNREYHTEKIFLEKGDEIYLFSDGITDQFGGDNQNKKLGKKNLRKLIQTDFKGSMREKVDYIKEMVESWMGKNSQTDDITLIGLRV